VFKGSIGAENQKCLTFSKKEIILQSIKNDVKSADIQNASLVRSVDGLFYHVSVKMLAALILMILHF